MARLPITITALLLTACSQPPATPDAGVFVCDVEAPTACTQPQLRFADVQPIITTHCVNCHDGTQGPWPLKTWSDVADWADIVRADVVDCSMPPLDAGIPAITTAERRLILDWIKCNYPR